MRTTDFESDEYIKALDWRERLTSGFEDADDLQDFIESILEAQKEAQRLEIIETIRGMKTHDRTNICDCGKEVEFFGWGFNEALEEVISKLSI
jgi:hypothetical protein